MPAFDDVIETRQQLRAVLPEPNDLVTRKVLSRLDRHCSAFINRAPFMLLASSDADGNVDVSPKGDPEGFVKIIDGQTLAIPDRLGNNRADSLENILQNPQVGVIFLIPGKRETLRISGTACIVRDQALRDSMAVRDRSPALAIIVTVEEAFFHCSKCMVRSGLWQPDRWPSLDGLPRLAETMVDAGKLEITEREMHEIIVKNEK
ncbi:MAG TPA: MSMEG_1061 family FMN-dependent PPOX-type flavoprotein, partial [Woeseiaceae bacterium]|nr:MSMEG_1061 family FMN-dependent PPOX-type flavoprotein [Woeseiaceae bacterium]